MLGAISRLEGGAQLVLPELRRRLEQDDQRFVDLARLGDRPAQRVALTQQAFG
jgi:hypothetical protein